MKKYLSVLIRVLLAAAGIAYIALTLTWTDQVLVPMATTLPDGTKLPKAKAYRIVAGEINDDEALTDLQLQIKGADGQVYQYPVAKAQIGSQPAQFQLRPGILRTLKHAGQHFHFLLLGFLLVGPIFPIQAIRWWLLMRDRGLVVNKWEAFRLTMIGSFFNFCMPGTTGGDLIKAYYVAKGSTRRADAVMSVIFDRLAGLFGLVLLAGLAGLFMTLTRNEPLARQITLYIWLGIGATIVGAAVYFSRRLRGALGVDFLISKLPGKGLLTKIDQAAVAYRDHKAVVVYTIIMSIPVHLMLASATAFAGYALDMEASFGLLLTVIPILFLAGSLPLTFQGVGVMEGLAMAMIYNPPHATANQIVGMLLIYRLFMVIYSVMGSLFLLRGDIHMKEAAAISKEEVGRAGARAGIVEARANPRKILTSGVTMSAEKLEALEKIEGIITVQQYIMGQRGPNRKDNGQFSWLLSAITLATKIISSYVRGAGLVKINEYTKNVNVQGELQHHLDVLANEALIHTLGYRQDVGVIASEEDNEPRVLQDLGEGGRYVVMFDPLDGSSNIDANVSVGTIFTILERTKGEASAAQSVLQPGTKQVAAGYVVYGSSTVLVITTGNGVHMFTLDNQFGAFLLTRANVRMPEYAAEYSANEAYAPTYPPGYQKYLTQAKTADGGSCSMRYIGSLVADFHRILLKGGVFLYPPTAKNPTGKLRLMYEANPLAFIAEQAGGSASDGKGRIMEIKPTTLHQRTPLVIGSKKNVEQVLACVRG